MAASKRDFTDYRNFGGSVNEGTGIYEFPVLSYEDKIGNTRVWQIFVRLVKKPETLVTTINWNLLSESQIKIKDTYFDGVDLPKDTYAESWVETGVKEGKITRSIPTYFKDVAFEGQINQRNPFQNALIHARDNYLGQGEKTGTVGELNDMYFPMLASKVDSKTKIPYPCYIQPKLDGIRCLCYLNKVDGGIDEVILYSRQKKEIPKDYIKKEVYEHINAICKKYKKRIYLDGELYKHGERLQDIAGEARNATTTQKIEYHIYDCFFPDELKMVFDDRQNILKEFFEKVDKKSLIKQVTTLVVNDKKEQKKIYDEFIKEGYEGAILRFKDSTYFAHRSKVTLTRSKQLLKLKEQFSEEYEIVGITEGKKGKDKGAVIWVCKTPKTSMEFNVTPKNMTYKERYEIFKKAKAGDNKYIGQMLTVEYQDLSRKGIPARAKGILVRDYE